MRSSLPLFALLLSACPQSPPSTDGAADQARPVDLAVGGADLAALDLAVPDLASPRDLATARDLAAADLARPRDLATGDLPPGICRRRANTDVRCGMGLACAGAAGACCRGESAAQGSCVAVGAPCAGSIFCCDDRSDCDPGEVCCHPVGAGSGCLPEAECAVRMGQRMCLADPACEPGEECCSGIPVPPLNDYCGKFCPISRLRYKREVAYLTPGELAGLKDQLLRFPLATYEYRDGAPGGRRHLGFIIDDVAPSPAVDGTGERVDLYGYTTMAVATLQAQAREIEELKRELAGIKRQLARQGRPARNR